MDTDRNESVKAKVLRLINSSSHGKLGARIEVSGDATFIQAENVHFHQRANATVRSIDDSDRKRREWRQELCGIIRSRAAELNVSEDQLTELASRMKRRVDSIDRLNAIELARCYDELCSKRPELEE